MAQKLTAQQSMLITGDCVRQVTHSTRLLNPQERLLLYGVNTPQQVSAVRSNVVANGNIGVPRFNFSLHPDFLATLSNAWTMGQLAGVIRQNSLLNQLNLAFVPPKRTEAEKLAVASIKFAEAAEIFAETVTKRRKDKKTARNAKKRTARKPKEEP